MPRKTLPAYLPEAPTVLGFENPERVHSSITGICSCGNLSDRHDVLFHGGNWAREFQGGHIGVGMMKQGSASNGFGVAHSRGALRQVIEAVLAGDKGALCLLGEGRRAGSCSAKAT